MSVDRMAVIERKECAECGTPMYTDGRILCPYSSEHIGAVVVEYVPAEQLRGAVEALDTIRAATGANYSTAHVGAVARRAICAYDSRFGGEE